MKEYINIIKEFNKYMKMLKKLPKEQRLYFGFNQYNPSEYKKTLIKKYVIFFILIFLLIGLGFIAQCIMNIDDGIVVPLFIILFLILYFEILISSMKDTIELVKKVYEERTQKQIAYFNKLLKNEIISPKEHEEKIMEIKNRLKEKGLDGNDEIC